MGKLTSESQRILLLSETLGEIPPGLEDEVLEALCGGPRSAFGATARGAVLAG